MIVLYKKNSHKQKLKTKYVWLYPIMLFLENGIYENLAYLEKWATIPNGFFEILHIFDRLIIPYLPLLWI